MRDLVICAITNYSFDHIKYWCNSLERSGFTGEKMIICYNVPSSTIHELRKRNYTVNSFGLDPSGNSIYNNPNFSIVVDRFFHYWVALRNAYETSTYRYVIATDVKDVIFQKNPSEWLEQHFDNSKSYILSSEGLRYQHEPWGNHNLFRAFGPALHGHYHTKEIVNCGVLAGKFQSMVDLFLNIYLVCQGAPHHVEGGGGPDQAALNILTSLQPFRDHAQIERDEHAWAAQLGTLGDPSKLSGFLPNILFSPPIFHDKMFYTLKDEPYTIVHQWDRMQPEITSQIREKYS